MVKADSRKFVPSHYPSPFSNWSAAGDCNYDNLLAIHPKIIQDFNLKL